MSTVTTTASMKIPATIPHPVILEFQIAMLQLSAALLAKSAGGMTKRYVTSQPALSSLVKQLKSCVKRMDDKTEATELMELLDDVALDLGNLRQT